MTPTLSATGEIINGDVSEIMEMLPDESVNCCVTSPPYWGLRDYGVDGQLGLEKTPEKYVDRMVEIFRDVRRVLRNDGTLWLNLGDSYASFRDGKATPDTSRGDNTGTLVPKGKAVNRMSATFDGSFVKHKDLVGIPWRVAFALQADGWYLRQDIIWHKPNPMPESVTDRCTKSHEYIFLLSKSAKYYYDHEAIKEKANYDGRKDEVMKGSDKYANVYVPNHAAQSIAVVGHEHDDGNRLRNKRSVWTVATQPFRGAHFATFPPKLIEPCILAGCPNDGVVLDPFMGSGTVALEAIRQGKRYLGIELNPEYVLMANKRIYEATKQMRML